MEHSGDIELPADLSAESTRCDLARVVAALLDKWNVRSREQLLLLGMSTESRKLLAQYRRGELALPNTRDSLDRVGFLLGIHKGLRLLFPEDPELRYGWVHRSNRNLEGRTPLQVMIDEGLPGLFRISRFVDYQRGQ